MESKNSATTAVITLVIGVLVGGGIGYAAGMGGSDTKETKSTSAMSSSAGEDGVTVGGAKMVSSKDIVDNAAGAKNVSTLVSAVKAAGLVETLKMEGPYTVFGPNNDAFKALPAGTVDTLLMPENKDKLVAVLTYHVVPGTYTSADLRAMANKGETLISVQGGILTPVLEDNQVKIKDAKGNTVSIETADVISSNGVTHVVDSVLMN